MMRCAVRVGVSILVAATLTLSACASNKESTGNPTGTTQAVTTAAGLTSLVPADLAKRGYLIVGIDPTYAPNEYKNSKGTIVGFDVELFNAVAAKLGLKTRYVASVFDNIIPGITAPTPKYDIGVASFTDNRLREKTVDFVNYFSAGSQWAAKTGAKVDPANACGLKVAVQTGTVQDTDDLPARSKACTKAGKKPITNLRYASQANATTAVILGKAVAFVADSPVTAYGVKTSAGKLALVGKIYDAAPYGYPMKKNSKLVPAVQKALQSLITDGTYAKICGRWGDTAGAIKTATVNGAIS